MIKKIFESILKHKIITGIVIVIAGAGIYYFYNSLGGSTNQTSYVSAAVEKGTLITSVSGSGQVSASSQVDINPKVSGDVTSVGIKNGQEVKTGQILVQLNTQDAQKTVRDAQDSLDVAELTLEKLKQPADQLSILQAQNALSQAKQSKQTAQDDLEKTYDNGFNVVANAFLDLPTIMTGLNDVLFGNTFSSSAWNMDFYSDTVKIYDEKAVQYRDDAYQAYETARAAYDKNFNDYKSASRFSTTETIESLISETYDTTKQIAEAVKNANNLIQFYKDELTDHNLKPSATADTHLSSLNTYTGKTNTHLTNLLSATQTIKNDKEAITSSDQSIAEKTESLANLLAGPDAIDLKSQELSVRQKENALLDAKQKLADYSIRAPFDGVIAETSIKKGDSVSSATAVATLITKQRLAEISLNEVDVAKVKVGQKVTLTFDAIEELTISGEVAEINAIGTITQGVVSYNVKISFDTQDERVKPGMSVSAVIITEMKQDVLLVPNAAVKSNGDGSYVETLTNNIPQSQTVEIGLSNDTMTEITSGLKEGDQVVTQTTTTATTKTTTGSSNRSFGIPGIGGGPRD